MLRLPCQLGVVNVTASESFEGRGAFEPRYFVEGILVVVTMEIVDGE